MFSDINYRNIFLDQSPKAKEMKAKKTQRAKKQNPMKPDQI